jgi:hypothetical protein
MVVGIAGNEVLNAIVFLHFGARLAPGGAALGLKGIHRHTLDVALVGNQNHHLLIGNQGNIGEFPVIHLNHGTAGVIELVP